MINARTTDPVTSHMAGYEVEASGIAHNHRLIALRAVKDHPGLTSHELSGECELDRNQIARRLPEIKEIEQGSKRLCRIGHNTCVTWWVKH